MENGESACWQVPKIEVQEVVRHVPKVEVRTVDRVVEAADVWPVDRATCFHLLGSPWFVARGLPTIYDDDGIQQRVRRDAKLYLLAMVADYMAMVQYMSLKLIYSHQNYQGESRKPQ